MNTKISSFILLNKFLLLIASLNFLLVYVSSFIPGYEYFIDEFYYIACANRPAFGYVDHPPLAPLLLTIIQFLFGNSIYVIRFLPAVSISITVFLGGIIAREIGGKNFSQIVTAVCIAASPVLIAFSGFYSMNAFEPLIAILVLYVSVKMVKQDSPGKWIIAGILMGLGMMNKHTFALFIFALVLSLLLSGKWRLVFNKWFVFGSLIAFIIFLPNIIWQMLNGFPSIEFYRNITVDKNVYTPPLEFIKMQLMFMSPINALIWIPGIFYLLISKNLREFRFLGALFLIIFILMLVTGSSRPDRVTFAYPAVFAGGALFFENFIQRYNVLKVLKFLLIFLLYAGLILFVPLFIPYLTYEQNASYVNFIGINTELEKGNKPLLTQLLADRIGWEERVALVNKAYQKLSEDEKKRTIIVGSNYGQAGALEFYGKKYNFPRVVSGHNNYYLWNKGMLNDKSIAISLEHPDGLHGALEEFESVDTINAVYTNPYVTFHENNLTVFICRNPKIPFNEMLEKIRYYY